MIGEGLPEPTIEKPRRSELFSHLFPGNRLEDLPAFNALTSSKLLKRMLVDDDIAQGKFVDAFESKLGYARRIDIGSSPDKLSVAYNLLDTYATKENAAALRGWISDLLKEGEKLGGVGRTQISWLKKAVRQNGVNSLVPAIINQADLYDVADATVIGVLSPEGKPTALIQFRRGERPPGGKEVQKTVIAAKPLSQPITVGNI